MKSWLLVVVLSFFHVTGWAQWSTSGSSIYYIGGNVGIGTNTPVSNLDIATTSGDGLALKYGSAGFVRFTGNSMPSAYLNPLTLGGDAAIIFGQSSVDAITTGLVIAPYRSSMCGLRIDNNGNVGIKTNNTQNYTLAVNGSAIFTSAWVKPYFNWPDYVFNRDYSLPSLDSVSLYIQQNHHLLDIPSADSIRKSGLDLGGNQALLLKKIEELTLYLIDQHKEFDSLKIQSSQMMVENDHLKQECRVLREQVTASRELMERVQKMEAWIKNQARKKRTAK